MQLIGENISMKSGKENNYLTTTYSLPLQHAIEQVAGFLFKSVNGKESECQPVTLTGISFLLSTNPELVNESLFSLVELGAIKLEHRRIVVRDQELLQNIAVCD
jgi:hypothetical protein